MGQFWGSAGEPVRGTVDSGESVEVDVAVSDDDEIRLSALGGEFGQAVATIVFDMAAARELHDLLGTAIREGRWLA